MDLLKLGALLDSDKYIIPVYQREFAWSEGELIRLVKDIEDSRKEGKEEYYMGSLVTFFIDGYYELVDGQQRLTALSLLFSLFAFSFSESSLLFSILALYFIICSKYFLSSSKVLSML